MVAGVVTVMCEVVGTVSLGVSASSEPALGIELMLENEPSRAAYSTA